MLWSNEVPLDLKALPLVLSDLTVCSWSMQTRCDPRCAPSQANQID